MDREAKSISKASCSCCPAGHDTSCASDWLPLLFYTTGTFHRPVRSGTARIFHVSAIIATNRSLHGTLINVQRSHVGQ